MSTKTFEKLRSIFKQIDKDLISKYSTSQIALFKREAFDLEKLALRLIELYEAASSKEAFTRAIQTYVIFYHERGFGQNNQKFMTPSARTALNEANTLIPLSKKTERAPEMLTAPRFCAVMASQMAVLDLIEGTRDTIPASAPKQFTRHSLPKILFSQYWYCLRDYLVLDFPHHCQVFDNANFAGTYLNYVVTNPNVQHNVGNQYNFWKLAHTSHYPLLTNEEKRDYLLTAGILRNSGKGLFVQRRALVNAWPAAAHCCQLLGESTANIEGVYEAINDWNDVVELDISVAAEKVHGKWPLIPDNTTSLMRIEGVKDTVEHQANLWQSQCSDFPSADDIHGDVKTDFKGGSIGGSHDDDDERRRREEEERRKEAERKKKEEEEERRRRESRKPPVFRKGGRSGSGPHFDERHEEKSSELAQIIAFGNSGGRDVPVQLAISWRDLSAIQSHFNNAGLLVLLVSSYAVREGSLAKGIAKVSEEHFLLEKAGYSWARREELLAASLVEAMSAVKADDVSAKAIHLYKTEAERIEKERLQIEEEARKRRDEEQQKKDEEERKAREQKEAEERQKVEERKLAQQEKERIEEEERLKQEEERQKLADEFDRKTSGLTSESKPAGEGAGREEESGGGSESELSRATVVPLTAETPVTEEVNQNVPPSGQDVVIEPSGPEDGSGQTGVIPAGQTASGGMPSTSEVETQEEPTISASSSEGSQVSSPIKTSLDTRLLSLENHLKSLLVDAEKGEYIDEKLLRNVEGELVSFKAAKKDCMFAEAVVKKLRLLNVKNIANKPAEAVKSHIVEEIVDNEGEINGLREYIQRGNVPVGQNVSVGMHKWAFFRKLQIETTGGMVSSERAKADMMYFTDSDLGINTTVPTCLHSLCKARGYSPHRDRILNVIKARQPARSEWIFKLNSEVRQGVSVVMNCAVVHAYAMMAAGAYNCEFTDASRLVFHQSWMKYLEAVAKEYNIFNGVKKLRKKGQLLTEGGWLLLDEALMVMISETGGMKGTIYDRRNEFLEPINGMDSVDLPDDKEALNFTELFLERSFASMLVRAEKLGLSRLQLFGVAYRWWIKKEVQNTFFSNPMKSSDLRAIQQFVWSFPISGGEIRFEYPKGRFAQSFSGFSTFKPNK